MVGEKVTVADDYKLSPQDRNTSQLNGTLEFILFNLLILQIRHLRPPEVKLKSRLTQGSEAS